MRLFITKDRYVAANVVEDGNLIYLSDMVELSDTEIDYENLPDCYLKPENLKGQ